MKEVLEITFKKGKPIIKLLEGAFDKKLKLEVKRIIRELIKKESTEEVKKLIEGVERNKEEIELEEKIEKTGLESAIITIEPKERIDIIKDFNIRGRIGEVIAYYYLKRKMKLILGKVFRIGFYPIQEIKILPFLARQNQPYEYGLEKYLKEEQIKFLRESYETDMIGIILSKPVKLYLIEVKTSLTNRFSIKRREAYYLLKSIEYGFIPLLVFIEFLPNTKIEVINIKENAAIKKRLEEISEKYGKLVEHF